jgi:hypothetical protein
MPSNKSSLKDWQSINTHEQVEIGLVHVEIAYHRNHDSRSLQHEELKDLLRDCFQTVAEHWGGKLFSWERHGGAFMFLVEGRESYDNCCLAAIQMLEMIPSLNQDLRSSKGPGCGVEVRIACDCGPVAYDPEPSNIPVDFANHLTKRAREVTTENWVTITERIYRQLTAQCQSRFQSWKYSSELDAALYRAPQSHEAGNSPAPAAAPPSQTDGKGAGTTADPPPAKKRTAKRTAPGRRRRLAGFVGPWQAAVVGLVALLVVEFFVIRSWYAATSPAASPAAAADWIEEVRASEWLDWRNRVHPLLSSPQLNDETLTEALRVKRPEVRTPPAAVLRHDQAVGAVLESYPLVRQRLEERLGLIPPFLGTGYSNPVHAGDYEHVSLHEYLIPNLPDTNKRVWMRKIKLETVVAALDKTMKDLVEEKTEDESSREALKKAMVAHAEAGDKETVMVRFAILDEKKHYKGTLGHPKRVRVFACDLAEVWKLKIQEAAERSGYVFSDGDTLFIWVFMPASRREAVLATWSQVLEHLPEWMERRQ